MPLKILVLTVNGQYLKEQALQDNVTTVLQDCEYSTNS